jgi:hypothetical protein
MHGDGRPSTTIVAASKRKNARDLLMPPAGRTLQTYLLSTTITPCLTTTRVFSRFQYPPSGFPSRRTISASLPGSSVPKVLTPVDERGAVRPHQFDDVLHREHQVERAALRQRLHRALETLSKVIERGAASGLRR